MSPSDLTPYTSASEIRQRLEVTAHLSERAQAVSERAASRVHKASAAGEELNTAALLLDVGRISELGRLIASEAVALAADIGGEDVPAE